MDSSTKKRKKSKANSKQWLVGCKYNSLLIKIPNLLTKMTIGVHKKRQRVTPTFTSTTTTTTIALFKDPTSANVILRLFIKPSPIESTTTPCSDLPPLPCPSPLILLCPSYLVECNPKTKQSQSIQTQPGVPPITPFKQLFIYFFWPSYP